MKTEDDIRTARTKVNQVRMDPSISDDQGILLMGMSVALCWVAESPNGSTLERLIQGEKVEAGKGGR
jgi:hypothetical protein